MTLDQWYWNLVPDSRGLHEKEEVLKQFENKLKKMNESFENSKDKSSEGSET